MLNFTVYPPHKVLGKEEIRDAQTRAQEVRLQNERLREEIQRLSSIIEAMWEIIKTKLPLSDSELKDMIGKTEIKHLNGAAAIYSCKDCSRPISVKSKICIFCGAKNEKPDIF